MKLEKFLINEKGEPLSKLRKTNIYKHVFGNDRKKVGFEEIYKKLRKDCAPFFKEIKSNPQFLYRNMERSELFGKKKVRFDRTPRDTDAKVHNHFDKVLDDLYGFKGRSQSVFCSGDENWGGAYGYSFMVFPIGKFKYIWSPTTKDSYKFVGDGGLGNILREYYSDDLIILWNEYNEKHPDMNITLDKYGTSLITNFINNAMINKVNGSSLTNKEIKLVYSVIEKAVDKLNYKNTDFLGAIKSKNEIMIHCSSYYYFSTYELRALMQMGLFGKTI